MSSAKVWFVVSVAAWTAFAVLMTTWLDVTHVFTKGVNSRTLSDFAITLAQMYTLGLATPLLIYVAHAFPPTRRPLLALAAYVAAVIAACIVGIPLFLFVSNEFLGKHYTIQYALGEGIF